MKKLTLAASALLATTLAGATPAAAAPKPGDTVVCATGLNSGLTCTPGAFQTASAASEFIIRSNAFGDTFKADFSEGLLTITNVNLTWSNFGFRDAGIPSLLFGDVSEPFQQAILVGTTGVRHFDQSNITFNNGVVAISFGQGGNFTLFSPGASFSVQLAPAIAGSVPEPAAWAMMILGMGAVGLALRRRAHALTLSSAARPYAGYHASR